MKYLFYLNRTYLFFQNMNIIQCSFQWRQCSCWHEYCQDIWPSVSPIYAQIKNQTSAATIDQLASNLTQANSELPIKLQLKAEILVPIFYNNGTNIEAEKYRILFEELVKQFGAVSSEDNNIINGYWINPQDNKAYADKNKV
jgi:hypothetical protein